MNNITEHINGRSNRIKREIDTTLLSKELKEIEDFKKEIEELI